MWNEFRPGLRAALGTGGEKLAEAIWVEIDYELKRTRPGLARKVSRMVSDLDQMSQAEVDGLTADPYGVYLRFSLTPEEVAYAGMIATRICERVGAPA